MNQRILITGSSGLVGSALSPALEHIGDSVRLFDLNAQCASKGDVRDLNRVRSMMSDCDGVIHLAAV